MRRVWKRAGIPQLFAFLASDDDLDAAELLTGVTEGKRAGVAHELALAFHAAHLEFQRQVLASEATGNARRIAEALISLERAEQLLRAANWPEWADLTGALSNRVKGQAGVFSEFGRIISNVAASLPPQYWPWPEPLKVGRRPLSWRQVALSRIRALGFGRPTATTLLKIALDAGRRAPSIPGVVQSALARECELRGGWRLLTQPAPPRRSRTRKR